MAHKTLVNNEIFEISGGIPYIDETSYNIVGGKVLIGGVTYDVEFGCKVTIITEEEASFRGGLASVTINGEEYNSVPSIFDNIKQWEVIVDKGTIIDCYAVGNAGATQALTGTSRIFINGKLIVSSYGGSTSWEYQVNSDITILLKHEDSRSGSIYIIEQ